MKQENLNQHLQGNDGSPAPLPLRSPAQRWLASLLLKRRGRLLPRFALFYQRLARLPRRMRRGLMRRTAATLAGAALLLALGRVPTTHAATINVDGTTCTLEQAILSAEYDTSYGSCEVGSGADTISLQTDVTLYTPYDFFYESETGLPRITTTITIEGNGHTIERDAGAAEKFRLFAVTSSGDLTLNNVTLSGGYAYFYTSTPNPYYPPYYVDKYYDGDGGAIYSLGTLTISNSTISYNRARETGGGVESRGPGNKVTITDTVFRGNEADDDGGGLSLNDGNATIRNSRFYDNRSTGTSGAIDTDGDNITTISDSEFFDNYSYASGGGLDFDGTATITNSTITGNESGDGGAGGINVNGEVTIRNSTIAYNIAADDGGGIGVDFGSLTLIESTVSYNYSAEEGGGIASIGSLLTITKSTISGNSAYEDAGGVFNVASSETTISNSTISGNRVISIYGAGGGGIYNEYSALTIVNSTITGNTTQNYGGGIYNGGGEYSELTIVRSLVSGNQADYGSELFNSADYFNGPGTVTAANHNLFGHDVLNNTQAFVNFTPGATDINATSSGDDILLTNILYIYLDDNGGPVSGAPGLEEMVRTHALVPGSAAIDKAPNGACNSAPTSGVDQRGYGRNANGVGGASTNECDIGAFEFNGAVAPPVGGDFFMTAAGPGKTKDGLNFGKEDILSWDGSNWSKFFDGTDEGLTAKHDVNAIHVNNGNDIYLSFFQNKIATVGLGSVFGTDIVHFDGSGFDWYFDGSDVGLATVGKEKIDALHILDGSVSPINGGNCLAYLLISTHGVGQVPQFGGGTINFKGEDILGFCATGLGENTSGHWHMVLDGSAEGMPGNSTDSISASAGGQTIYLTTKGKFKVDSVAGGHSMVYEYDTASGTFSGPIFNATANGLTRKADGLHMP